MSRKDRQGLPGGVTTADIKPFILRVSLVQAYFLADFPASAANRVSEKLSFLKNFDFLALGFQFLLEFK